MRLLVTGASGQLGGYLLRTLAKQATPVVAWSGSRSGRLFDVALRPVDLADVDAGVLGRAVRGHRGNECALRLIRVEPEALGDRRSDALDRDAEPAARHVPVLS